MVRFAILTIVASLVHDVFALKSSQHGGLLGGDREEGKSDVGTGSMFNIGASMPAFGMPQRISDGIIHSGQVTSGSVPSCDGAQKAGRSTVAGSGLVDAATAVTEDDIAAIEDFSASGRESACGGCLDCLYKDFRHDGMEITAAAADKRDVVRNVGDSQFASLTPAGEVQIHQKISQGGKTDGKS